MLEMGVNRSADLLLLAAAAPSLDKSHSARRQEDKKTSQTPIKIETNRDESDHESDSQLFFEDRRIDLIRQGALGQGQPPLMLSDRPGEWRVRDTRGEGTLPVYRLFDPTLRVLSCRRTSILFNPRAPCRRPNRDTGGWGVVKRKLASVGFGWLRLAPVGSGRV